MFALGYEAERIAVLISLLCKPGVNDKFKSEKQSFRDGIGITTHRSRGRGILWLFFLCLSKSAFLNEEWLLKNRNIC